MSVVCWLITL
uniref:Uncharacterized protein n=1 Tax=Anguilla anguilla TaxID=7936 RepID=A0A0E9S2I3_ANGAN